MQVLLLNLRQELSTAAGLGNIVPDCSDQLLHSALRGPALLGHNEDNSGDLLNASYFIQTEVVRLFGFDSFRHKAVATPHTPDQVAHVPDVS